MIRIYDANETRQYITQIDGGYVFDDGKGHKNYGLLTPAGYNSIPKLYVEGALSQISKVIPIDWLDLDIYIVPMCMLTYNEIEQRFIGSVINGQSWKGVITLGDRYGKVSYEEVASTLLHEIGHELAYRYIDDTPFDLIDTPEYKRFKELAGIEKFYEHNTIWEDRPGEILAETIRYFVGQQDPIFNYNPYVCFDSADDPKPSREAYEYLISFIGNEVKPQPEPDPIIPPQPPVQEEPKSTNKVIIDISHHQIPGNIDYDKLAKQISFAIVRTQYGSRLIDKYYRTHHAELRKRGIPTAAYAWVRGINEKDMEIEATDFYNRTKDINPTFWFLDVEEQSMADMRSGVKAYVKKLRELGAKKIGVYIAHHLYEKFNLDMNDFDAVWIPHYGVNNGKVNSTPKYECDIHQYTSTGRLEGYNGNLDLNRLMGTKPLEFFISENYIKDYFKDDNGKWHEKFNNRLAELGIIEGDGQGNIRPEDYAKRAEVFKIASVLYDLIMEEVNKSK